MRLLWAIALLLSPGYSLQHRPPRGESFFLDNIFRKYGDSGKLTFEGFEHLMESLGLGRLKFDKNHTVWMHKTPDGGFREVHDTLKLHFHDHVGNRSRRSSEASSATEEEIFELGEAGVKLECLTPQEILIAHGLEPSHEVEISPEGFVNICPAIVYQLDQKVCTIPPPPILNIPPTPTAVAWLYASLSIIVISLSGLVGVSLVPILERALFHNVLNTLVALAVGTLCGDALLHLLPHALLTEEGNHSTTILKSTTAFLTVLLFFFLEACLHGNHGHSHGNEEEKPVEYSVVTSKEVGGGAKVEGGSGKGVGRLVVIGDSLHNLTDGVAIGAAFRGNPAAGLATALAVLTHELPHELGDFAVLLKTGMSVKRAIYFNILSSVLSFIGMAGGIYIGDHKGATHWVYAATAGSFLYIALADLVPELHKYRTKDPLKNTLLQLVGTLMGGGIMFLIAVYEESLFSLFSEESSD